MKTKYIYIQFSWTNQCFWLNAADESLLFIIITWLISDFIIFYHIVSLSWTLLATKEL